MTAPMYPADGSGGFEPPTYPAPYPPDSYPPTVGYPPLSAPPASPGPYPPSYGYAPAAGYPVSPAYPNAGYAGPTPYPMAPGAAMVPAAFVAVPIGAVDPLTGQMWSDKTRSSAGLLQLLPAIFFAVGGIGRLYAGNIGLGVTQICLTVLGWVSFWCGFALILPWFISGGLWLWFVIDGILMLTGRPVDAQGRTLRY